jgi:hypothetical protein
VGLALYLSAKLRRLRSDRGDVLADPEDDSPECSAARAIELVALSYGIIPADWNACGVDVADLSSMLIAAARTRGFFEAVFPDPF